MDLVNNDFPSQGSPVKDGGPIFDSSATRTLSDVACERPKYDVTPAPLRADVGSHSGDIGDRSAGPFFDTSPHRRVDTDAAMNSESPLPEHTPVYQDTPSQTVDGTEEVTQEHNVQEQLQRYEAAHAARSPVNCC